MIDSPLSFDSPLPTFSVLARFQSTAETGGEAEREVTSRLLAAQEPVHEVNVERQEDSGVWMVTARFVLVSVDGHTAVGGLHETLTIAGLRPDEVWLDHAIT